MGDLILDLISFIVTKKEVTVYKHRCRQMRKYDVGSLQMFSCNGCFLSKMRSKKKKRSVKNLSREEKEIINSLGKPRILQSFSSVPILCSNISLTLENHFTEVKLKLGRSNVLSRIKHVGSSCI